MFHKQKWKKWLNHNNWTYGKVMIDNLLFVLQILTNTIDITRIALLAILKRSTLLEPKNPEFLIEYLSYTPANIYNQTTLNYWTPPHYESIPYHTTGYPRNGISCLNTSQYQYQQNKFYLTQYHNIGHLHWAS